MKLIINTEERPKKSTLATILNTLYSKNLTENDITITPIFSTNGNFSFYYIVKTKDLILNFEEIMLELVSGSSSFIDYLIFEEDNFGNKNLIAMIEETKTDDSESRNTGVYQRASKFVYANLYYPNIPKYMLYASENDSKKMPSQTAKFGSKLLKTIGVNIVGKNHYYNRLVPFESVDEIIEFKNKMRRPPLGNTPILIEKNYDLSEGYSYSITGILSKPKLAGNIAHDPNIGALTLISAGIRSFDKTTPIYINEHYVSQEYISKIEESQEGNKFLYIAAALDIKLAGLNYNHTIFKNNEKYFHIENSSEKVTTIFLHIILENIGSKLIYENHAGCERGYFHKASGEEIALPKRIGFQELYIPDLVIQLPTEKVLVIEGKKLSTLSRGIKELNNYDFIEEHYIKPDYNSPLIERWVTTFGGNIKEIPHKKVLLHINKDGSFILNSKAPSELIEALGKVLNLENKYYIKK